MACAACAAKSGATPSYRQPKQRSNRKATTQEAIDCPFSNGLLMIWYNALKCVKDTNQLAAIGLTVYQTNVHLGNLQSAMNYPDNYCYFRKELTDFNSNILPRIIENVPNCI